jgi:hypothetical protein
MAETYSIQDFYTVFNNTSLGIGKSTDAAVTPGSVGTVNGKLRQMSKDINDIYAALGLITDAAVEAGAGGSVQAKISRLTTDLGLLKTALGLTTDLAVNAGAEGSLHAKIRQLTADISAVKTAVTALTNGVAITTIQDNLNRLLGTVKMSGNVVIDSAGRYGIAQAVIPINDSISNAVTVGANCLAGIIMPSGWDTAAISFLTASAVDGAYQPIFGEDGLEVSITAAAGHSIALSDSALKLAPWTYLKLRSGVSTGAINQTGSRTITLILKY